MSLAPLLEIIHSGTQNGWSERNKAALEALFGSPEGRYPKSAAKAVTLRAPEMNMDSGVPFAAYIHPANPSSGPYSGLSFVIFPITDGPCLVGLVVGTQGLSPDEAILGRPGARSEGPSDLLLAQSRVRARIFRRLGKTGPNTNGLSAPDNVRQT